jgi:glycosyltransferase involved in cell wall biosynthesis
MGKPVIVTAVGALPELVMPAITGWLLPPDDPGEIAWALELALRMSEDVRERVAFRARQFIAESFEAETILERQLGLYAELLGMAPPVRATATRAAAA